MKAHALMSDDQLVKKAVGVLVREIGAVETSRFFSMPQQKRMESVKRHRIWQKTLDKDKFFTDVFK